MKFDKLTIKSQEALSEAQSLATARGHSQITSAHLLQSLLAQPEGSTIPILQKIGVSIDPLQNQTEKKSGKFRLLNKQEIDRMANYPTSQNHLKKYLPDLHFGTRLLFDQK